MEDLRARTIQTYDESAPALAEYFKGIGPRTIDIDRAFELAGNPEQARVVEIGCGDGRDAKEIAPRCHEFIGFDPSAGMLAQAKEHAPEINFQLGDAETFEYPDKLDIVFSFASLLHSNAAQIAKVLHRVHTALRTGGIFYISLKERPSYEEEVQDDKYGRRKFYYYNAAFLKMLTGGNYTPVSETNTHVGNTDWFELALKKV